MAKQTLNVPSAILRDLAAAIFRAHGVPEGDALRVADCLIRADLRGIGSHGVSRIPIYTERLRKGLVNPTPSLTITHGSTVGGQIDGDNGLGFVVATRAMEEAIRLAKLHGFGMIFAHNSTHFGMAANYLLQALDAGMAAFVYTNASPAMPIWGGRDAFLGTSPYAFAAPGGKAGPVVLDMALSVVARGKIRRAAQKGEPIPLGWALDPEGKPTTDAQKGYDGIVLPLGGAKGSGLSLMMEIIAGVMSGSAFGGKVGNQYFDFDKPQNVGHCFMALRPDLCVSADEYRARMDDLVARSKGGAKAEGFEEILMPGEPEARNEAKRLHVGIPIEPDDLDMLATEAARFGIAVPDELRQSVSSGN